MSTKTNVSPAAVRAEWEDRARERLLKGMERTARGKWLIWSEDAIERLLGVVEGRFEDAVEHAVKLRDFFEWGSGGRLERVEIKKLPNLAERRRIEEARRQQLTLPESEPQKVYKGIKRVPSVGDEIYVPSGSEEWGGKAIITDVDEGISAGKPTINVRVDEHPGVSYNWQFLEPSQPELARMYGEQWASTDH
jgi:hypothetical protein